MLRLVLLEGYVASLTRLRVEIADVDEVTDIAGALEVLFEWPHIVVVVVHETS